MNIKYLKLYHCTLFLLGVFLFIFGVYDQSWLLIMLGIFNATTSGGTAAHLLSGIHNRFSLLPAEFKIKNN